MYTKDAFAKELFDIRAEYRADNKWVQSWSNWDDDGVMKTFIAGAYNLYKATATNKLHLTLLGDTEIRSMASLITNFGLVSGNGVQEKRDEVMIAGLDERRSQIAKGAKPGLNKPVAMLGPGAILSDKMWTPMLNDALMLGAIQGRQDFILALNTKEQASYEASGYNSVKVSSVAQKAQMFGGQVGKSAEEKNWNAFFRKESQMIWSGATPRVFARELLALKFFGYKPIFSHLQLGFVHGGRPAVGIPGFRTYTTELRKLGFFEYKKDNVMGAIGEFLFNDTKALL